MERVREKTKIEMNVDYLHSNISEILIDIISSGIIEVTNTKYIKFIEPSIIQKEKEDKEKSLKEKQSPKSSLGSLISAAASVRR